MTLGCSYYKSVSVVSIFKVSRDGISARENTTLDQNTKITTLQMPPLLRQVRYHELSSLWTLY